MLAKKQQRMYACMNIVLIDGHCKRNVFKSIPPSQAVDVTSVQCSAVQFM